MLWTLFAIIICAAPEPIVDYAVQLSNGTTITTPQLQLSASGELRTKQQTFAVNDWLSIQRMHRLRPSYPTQAHLQLTNGDHLVGQLVKGDGDALYWRPQIGDKVAEQTLRFPLSAVAIVWQKTLARSEQPSWVNRPRQRDVIQLKNGDTILGTINKIDPVDGWRITLEQREQTIPHANVVALGCNTDLARQRLPRGVYYRVVFTNGSRLSCLSVVSDQQQLKLTTLMKDVFTVPSAEMIAIDVAQSKAIPLHELKPTRYDYQSFDGELAQWSVNRTINGQPLQLRFPQGDSTYEHGLSIPAGSTLTYDLAGKYQRFMASVGIDISQGERGSATLTVLLDGQPVAFANKGLLTVKQGVFNINLDVRGVKEMKLIVARHEGGFVQAAINVVQPWLVP